MLQPHHSVEPIAHKYSNSGLLCALVYPHPEGGAEAKKKQTNKHTTVKRNAIIQGKIYMRVPPHKKRKFVSDLIIHGAKIIHHLQFLVSK